MLPYICVVNLNKIGLKMSEIMTVDACAAIKCATVMGRQNWGLLSAILIGLDHEKSSKKGCFKIGMEWSRV